LEYRFRNTDLDWQAQAGREGKGKLIPKPFKAGTQTVYKTAQCILYTMRFLPKPFSVV